MPIIKATSRRLCLESPFEVELNLRDSFSHGGVGGVGKWRLVSVHQQVASSKKKTGVTD